MGASYTHGEEALIENSHSASLHGYFICIVTNERLPFALKERKQIYSWLLIIWRDPWATIFQKHAKYSPVITLPLQSLVYVYCMASFNENHGFELS